MYKDPEEIEELWTILTDKNLMSLIMSMPLDIMNMEEQLETEVESVNTESTLDKNPECDVVSANPTPELTEQLAVGKAGSKRGDASNFKVGKPPGSKKQLTWLQTMWAIVPLNIWEWAK